MLFEPEETKLVPAVADTLPPATILDLAAGDSTETSLTLRFTAPADSVSTDAEGSGVPSAYAVRFQLSGGAPFNWSLVSALFLAFPWSASLKST
jgi:hypothetical protein